MEERFQRYFEVLEQLGAPKGDWKQGEIEIVTDPKLMLEAEERSGQTVGVIDEDRFVLHLRDAVLFPPKVGSTEPQLGTYIRFVYTYELQKNLGVFILPINRHRQIVLNLTFRHALRRWVVEGCGTIAKSGEQRIETITRCVQQELGCDVISYRKLTDYFIPERGLIGGLVPMYEVQVDFVPKEVDDPTVRGHTLMYPDDFFEAVNQGTILIDGREYICCDGYTIAAVKMATHSFMAHEKIWLK